MIDVQKLCESFENCLGWPYASPGSNDENGIDCSGLFVKAFRDQGQKIYHGSNTIFREYLAESGTIQDASVLKPGMPVFKWNSRTPEMFGDGLGDFQHIGLVTSFAPLRIIHASSSAGRVICDSKIGKWKYWGWLKSAGVADIEKTQMVKIVSGGGKVNIRAGNGTGFRRLSSVPPGTTLPYITTAPNKWHAVLFGKQVGWVSGDYSEL